MWSAAAAAVAEQLSATTCDHVRLSQNPAQTSTNSTINNNTNKQYNKTTPTIQTANVEEARCLYENGWTYLDIRSEFELEESGKVKGAVNVPFVHIKRTYDSEKRERVVQKTDNEDFVKMVEKRFPDKANAKLIVGCSNGRAYSVDALEALDEAGYANLAWLKGGYQAWFNTFDNKLGRRRFGEYAETYMHDGDSCGIHASGAGFARVDAIERIQLPVY